MRADLSWVPLEEDPSIGMVMRPSGEPYNIVPIPLQDACEILLDIPIRVKIS